MFSIDNDDIDVVSVVASVEVKALVDSTVVPPSSTDTFVSFTGDIPILTTALIAIGIVNNINIRIWLEFIVVFDCEKAYFKSMPNVEKFLQIIMSSTVTLPAEIVDNLYLKKNFEDCNPFHVFHKALIFTSRCPNKRDHFCSRCIRLY